MLDIDLELEGDLFTGRAAARVDRAASEAAQQAADEAAARARQSTAFKDGDSDQHLRDSISGHAEGSYLAGTLDVVVRADSDHASYVNDGTPPHTIRPRRSRALKLKSLGDDVFAQKVNHPGTKATHFLEESIDEKRTLDLARAKVEDALGR